MEMVKKIAEFLEIDMNNMSFEDEIRLRSTCILQQDRGRGDFEGWGDVHSLENLLNTFDFEISTRFIKNLFPALEIDECRETAERQLRNIKAVAEAWEFLRQRQSKLSLHCQRRNI